MPRQYPVRILLFTLLIFTLQSSTSAQWKIFSLDSLSPGPLLLDQNAALHTLSFDESGFISHVTYSPAGWVRTPLYDGGGRFGTTSALCIDARGVLHAAFAFRSTSPTVLTSLYYANNEGGAWNPVQHVLTKETGIGDVSMASDRLNRIHITCLAASNVPARGALLYATDASGSWRADSIAEASNSAAIQVDLTDSIHVVFYGGYSELPYGLWYLRKGAGEWSAAEFIDSVGGQREGMGIGMAVDSSNRIHISYVRGGNEDHTHALREGGIWTRTFLDGGQFMAFGTSIAVDRNRNPHVVYHHVASKSLKYATNASGLWSTVEIDPAGGMFNRVGIDPHGYPHILYSWGNFPGVRWATTQPLPKLVVSPSALDFGEVGLGKSAMRTLAVKNAGDAPLVFSRIDAMGTNRSCFSWVNGCGIVAPGDSCEITVLFAPDTLADLTAGLRIFSNEPGSPAKVPLAGKGAGMAMYWAMMLGGNGRRDGTIIRELPDSGYILGGRFISQRENAHSRVWLVNLSPTGEVRWEKTMGTNTASYSTMAMEPLADGGLILGGYTYSVEFSGNAPATDAWIIRLDSTGHEVWQRAYGEGSEEYIRSIHPLPGGGFLATKFKYTSSEGATTTVMKLDEGGSILWQKTLRNASLMNSSPTSDGGVTLLVTSGGFPLPGGGISGPTSMLVNLSSSGSIRWAKYLPPELALAKGDLVRTITGGIVATFSTWSGTESVTFALDSFGNLLWSRKSTMQQRPGLLAGNWITQRPGGGFIIGGRETAGGSLVGISPSGAVEWSNTFPGFITDIRALPDSVIMIAGGMIHPGDPAENALVIRMDRNGMIPGCTYVQPGFVEDSAFALELSDWTPTISDGNVITVPISLTTYPIKSTRTLICSLVPVEDVDGDGLGDNFEWGPSGVNPLFDGNGDGIPDTQQSNVASFASGIMGQRYVTLASETGTELKEVRTVSNPSPPAAPDALFAYDFYSFRVTGLVPGDSATVRLILHGASWPADGYWKYGITTDSLPYHWYRFDYDGETGAVINGNAITLHFVDGKRGDDDLLANGEILEPGGPGWLDTLALGVRAGEPLPQETALYQNYPNPFNPSTTIAFDLAAAAHVAIRVYDIIGREVTVLVDEMRPAGRHRLEFNARSFASGVYFVRFQGAGRLQTKKMLLIR